MIDATTPLTEFDSGNLILGDTDQELSIDTREENRAAALSLVSQAQRSLVIMSRDLDPLIYGNPVFVDAVSALARRSRQTQIQILIGGSAAIVRDGHRLIPLSHRLSSSIQIRKMHKEFSRYNEAFLIADKTGVLHRPKADLYEARVSFKAPLKARELLDTFNTIWDVSAPDPELRRISL